MSQLTDVSSIAQVSNRIVQEVEKAIVGKADVVRQAVLVLLCSGHILLEDIPGVGKTTLAKALAKAIGGDFRRVQFTPDMLPSDVTGSSIYRQNTGEFEFRPGPVFANIVLVDEINRATPKTQSALLEAMEEQQVTTDGETRHLKRPFLVLATQNNLEMTGTFPLPEAQLDRFFARLTLGYPDREAEVNILADHQVSRPLDSVEQVCSPEDLIEAQNIVRRVHIDDSVRRYLVMVGGSPRGSLMLGLAAQAHAALEGNNFVRPENVKAVAGIVLGHRIIARGEVSARGMHNEQIIEQILQSVAVPVPMNA
jgi:MoxR-like ATPase